MEEQETVRVFIDLGGLKGIALYYNQKKAVKKHCRKSNHKKHKRFPKPGKLLRWLIQAFFVFVLHSMVNHASDPHLSQVCSQGRPRSRKHFSLPQASRLVAHMLSSDHAG